jgi:uncharacterized protein YjiS (DUF1127 family)
MAAIENTRSVTALNAGAISSFFANVVGSVAAWNDARITRKALSKLTARELDDIGLTLADVSAIGAITR